MENSRVLYTYHQSRPSLWRRIKAWMFGRPQPLPQRFLVYMVGRENKQGKFVDNSQHFYKREQKEIVEKLIVTPKRVIRGYTAYLEPPETSKNEKVGVFEVPDGTQYVVVDVDTKEIRCETLIYRRLL